MQLKINIRILCIRYTCYITICQISTICICEYILSLQNQVYIMAWNIKLSPQTDITTVYKKKNTHNLDRR